MHVKARKSALSPSTGCNNLPQRENFDPPTMCCHPAAQNGRLPPTCRDCSAKTLTPPPRSRLRLSRCLRVATMPTATPVAIPVAVPTQPTPKPQVRKGLPQAVVLGLVFGGLGAFLLLGLAIALVCFNAGGPSIKEPSGGTFGGSTPPPPLSPRLEKINATIDRGVAYLRIRLAEGGQFYSLGNSGGGAHAGVTGLLGLTLLECDTHPKDADVQKAARQVRQSGPNLRFTYSIALSILFLERLHSDPKGQPDQGATLQLIKTLALRPTLPARTAKAAGITYAVSWAKRKSAISWRPLRRTATRPVTSTRMQPCSAATTIPSASSLLLALWAARKQQVPVRLAAACGRAALPGAATA